MLRKHVKFMDDNTRYSANEVYLKALLDIVCNLSFSELYSYVNNVPLSKPSFDAGNRVEEINKAMLRRAANLKDESATEDPDFEDAVGSVGDGAGRGERGALGADSSSSDEDDELERLVLGDASHLVHSLTTGAAEYKDIQAEERTESDIQRKRRKKVVGERRPAWLDDDEDRVLAKQNKRLRYLREKQQRGKQTGEHMSGQEYSSALTQQFEKVAGNPEWAKLKWEREDETGSGSEDSSDDAAEIVRGTGDYLQQSSSLPSNVIQMKACTDANKQHPAKARISSVEFHPSAQVMLTSSLDHTLALFQVDGKNNPKIQSVFMDSFPIHQASFTRDGQQVVMTSQLRCFYYYDMIAGKVVNVPKFKGLEEKRLRKFAMSPDGQFIVFMGAWGNIHFVSAKTKELIETVKMNGSVESVAFAPDSTNMYSFGDDGEVYVWDMARRACIHRFKDDGCIKGTSLASSPNGQYLAAGSNSGVVNLYDTRSLTSSFTPSPVKAVMNLTSPCTHLKFNATTEILAMASDYTDNALKLLHVPSMSVFQNFPDRSEPLRVVQSIDFSLRSGFLTIGNHVGRALLYRVKHYKDF